MSFRSVVMKIARNRNEKEKSNWNLVVNVSMLICDEFWSFGSYYCRYLWLFFVLPPKFIFTTLHILFVIIVFGLWKMCNMISLKNRQNLVLLGLWMSFWVRQQRGTNLDICENYAFYYVQGIIDLFLLSDIVKSFRFCLNWYITRECSEANRTQDLIYTFVRVRLAQILLNFFRVMLMVDYHHR